MSEKLASVIIKFCYNHRFVIDTHHSTPQKYSFPKSFANNLRSKSTQKYTLGEISFKKYENYPPMLGMDQVVSLSEDYYALSFTSLMEGLGPYLTTYFFPFCIYTPFLGCATRIPLRL